MTDPRTPLPLRVVSPRPTRTAWLPALVVVAALLLALPLGTATAQVSVLDDLDREVRLEAPAERVVSMLPSHTETVCALDACDLLVGVDEVSVADAPVDGPRNLGNAFAADVESLLELDPDLVLTDPYSGLHEALTPLGVPVYVAVPETVDEVGQVIREIGTLLGRDARARALADDVRARVDELALEAASAESPTVYYEVDATPYSVGPASFLGELIDMAGGDNIVPAGMGAFPQLDPETVVSADPEVIVLADAPFGESAETLAERPGWADLRALRDGRVVELTQSQVDLLNRAGPRLPEALALLIEILHPELP